MCNNCISQGKGSHLQGFAHHYGVNSPTIADVALMLQNSWKCNKNFLQALQSGSSTPVWMSALEEQCEFYFHK